VDLVFIDPEPEGKSGGGIRTYINLMIDLCKTININPAVYSHNPNVYSQCPSFPIRRKPLKIFFFRFFLYRFLYVLNVKLEYSNWLNSELTARDNGHTLFEFCDFGGYAYYSLKSKTISKRVIVKIHTPEFLISYSVWNPSSYLHKRIELFCLTHTHTLSFFDPAYIQ